jgi:hypothetical protein
LEIRTQPLSPQVFAAWRKARHRHPTHACSKKHHLQEQVEQVIATRAERRQKAIGPAHCPMRRPDFRQLVPIYVRRERREYQYFCWRS